MEISRFVTVCMQMRNIWDFISFSILVLFKLYEIIHAVKPVCFSPSLLWLPVFVTNARSAL